MSILPYPRPSQMASPAVGNAHNVTALGVRAEAEPLNLIPLERRPLLGHDVLVQILYCGVCHSDWHHIRNDWGDSLYPMVPGHEIAGVVTEVGPLVSKVKVGQAVAVGNMVDSCRHCANCQRGEEQYCLNDGPSWTYNSFERVDPSKGNQRSLKPTGPPTFGGYSTGIVCHEDFVLIVPDTIAGELHRVAPLLCAGITMYDPLKRYQIGRGHKVGIAGIGGLGHLGIKFAKAVGAEVIALTRTEWKRADAMRLGADDAVLIDGQDSPGLAKYKDKLDFIIDTIPDPHNPNLYLGLLKPGHGKLHVVGNMEEFPGLRGYKFVFYGRDITSTNVGGIPTTQEMLDFCAQHRILAEVQTIQPNQANEAMQAMIANQVRYRFVIDWTGQDQASIPRQPPMGTLLPIRPTVEYSM